MKSKLTHIESAAPALRVDESVSLEDQISQRAYERWHPRGLEHGADQADWFQAEREVNERQQRLLQEAL